MSRLLFIAAILLFLDIVGYKILIDSTESREAYSFPINDHAFIYQKKDLILNEDEEFRFEEYFEILSCEDPSYHYSFKEDLLEVELEGERFTYPFSYREKEVIEHETVIVQQVPVYVTVKDDSTLANPSSQEAADHSSSSISSSDASADEPFIQLNQSSYSFPVQTELSVIIAEIRNAVTSNESVTIDYSLLNTSVKGSYPVVFISDHGSCTVTVEIV